jgi:ABC-type multidrug transport system fused ATPase/permease subunit
MKQITNISLEQKKTYTPVIVVAIVALLLTAATNLNAMTFMGFFLSLLACLKLMDIKSFVKGFVRYDLVSKRVKAYGYVYPFIELLAGLAMIKGVYLFPMGLVTLIVGFIGAVSVFKSVYMDKLNFNCACVGGNQNVPLGLVSFIENISMTAMGLYLVLMNYQ